MRYNVNNKGFYGEFGGSFIPEMLYSNIEELQKKYISILSKKSFQKEFDYYLEKYVGRPTPLYYADRLSKKYNETNFKKQVKRYINEGFRIAGSDWIKKNKEYE